MLHRHAIFIDFGDELTCLRNASAECGLRGGKGENCIPRARSIARNEKAPPRSHSLPCRIWVGNRSTSECCSIPFDLCSVLILGLVFHAKRSEREHLLQHSTSFTNSFEESWHGSLHCFDTSSRVSIDRVPVSSPAPAAGETAR